MLLTYGVAELSGNPALADRARDGADVAAKILTATSTGPQFTGSEIAVTDETTGVEYRAPMLERVRQGQIDPPVLARGAR